MASSIADFQAAMSGGGSRANQFRVLLTFPGFVSKGAIAGPKAQFLCHSAGLPDSTIGQAAAQFRGRDIKMAGERQFGNWDIVCYNDTDFAIRDAFEQWVDGMGNASQVGGLVSPSSYYADLSVTQLDRNGADIKTYDFIGCFPLNVGAIQLSFGANDQIEEFNVSFSLQYWTSNTTT
jgi:hypothetical protein